MRAVPVLVSVLAAVAALAFLLVGAVAGIATTALADPGPVATAQPNVTVQIPGGASNPSPSPSHGHGGGGGGGTTPTPTPTSTEAPATPTSPATGAPKLSIKPSRAHLGQRVSASAGGFAPNENVRLIIYPERIAVGDVQADSSGVLFGWFTVSKKLGTGTHTVEAIGWGSKHVATGSLTVMSGAVASTPGGGPLVTILVVTGVLAIVGILALIGVLNGWLPALFGYKVVA